MNALHLFLQALALFFSTQAHAFRVDPMVVSVPITSPKAAATYTVENSTKEKVALQFEVRQRLIDENGKEERPEAQGFLVYPEQMALEPGQRRSVRITWQNDSMPDKELAFRFVASQLPVSFDSATGAARKVNLKFLIEYVASLYFTPPNARAKIKVQKHLVTKQRRLEVLVVNEGSAHFLLDQLTVTAKGNGKVFQAEGDALKEARTENLLPGNRRWLRFPLPKDFPTKNLDVSVRFEP